MAQVLARVLRRGVPAALLIIRGRRGRVKQFLGGRYTNGLTGTRIAESILHGKGDRGIDEMDGMKEWVDQFERNDCLYLFISSHPAIPLEWRRYKMHGSGVLMDF
jgi:hypothetical protein